METRNLNKTNSTQENNSPAIIELQKRGEKLILSTIILKQEPSENKIYQSFQNKHNAMLTDFQQQKNMSTDLSISVWTDYYLSIYYANIHPPLYDLAHERLMAIIKILEKNQHIIARNQLLILSLANLIKTTNSSNAIKKYVKDLYQLIHANLESTSAAINDALMQTLHRLKDRTTEFAQFEMMLNLLIKKAIKCNTYSYEKHYLEEAFTFWKSKAINKKGNITANNNPYREQLYLHYQEQQKKIVEDNLSPDKTKNACEGLVMLSLFNPVTKKTEPPLIKNDSVVTEKKNTRKRKRNGRFV
jgi:hypothetical protein